MFLLLIIFVLLLSACAAEATSIPFSTPSKISPPSPLPEQPRSDFALHGETLNDISYCNTSAPLQKMDLYFPESEGPWPVLVYIHGGSWMHGDKSEAGLFAHLLRSQGYLVASVNYRLYPQVRFPAMIEDVKCAIRSLRAHADEFNLDADRIGVIGPSAGGHLSALLGTADESAGWDVGEYLDESSRVQAVVAMAAVTDLSQHFPEADIETMKLAGFDESSIVAASPINHVTAAAPPFLLIHGTVDTLVPLEQSTLMYERLIHAGVPAQLVLVENAGHSFVVPNGTSKPTFEEINLIILDFLAKYLK